MQNLIFKKIIFFETFAFPIHEKFEDVPVRSTKLRRRRIDVGKFGNC